MPLAIGHIAWINLFFHDSNLPELLTVAYFSNSLLAKWLKSHPQIEVVSRDRSRIYADAVNTALPHSAQVADRWHLMKNLGDLVEDYFVRHHQLLREVAAGIRAEQQAAQSEIALTSDAGEKLKVVPARRRHLFDEIKRLQGEGKSLHGIARELKIARNTVRRYARCDSLPNCHAGAGRPSLVVAFADYLEQRWRMGEHNAFRLWQEIRGRGFTGEVDAVRRFVQEWRKTPVGKINYSFSSSGMSPRQTTKLLLSPGRIKNENARNYLIKLEESSPAARKIGQLGRSFQRMVREKRADLFDGWLAEVRQSGVQDLINWANGLLADESAVRNALSSPWSNGQTEGQVNRLKTIKRQMYGRANFDLLRARVLHQA